MQLREMFVLFVRFATATCTFQRIGQTVVAGVFSIRPSPSVAQRISYSQYSWTTVECNRFKVKLFALYQSKYTYIYFTRTRYTYISVGGGGGTRN